MNRVFDQFGKDRSPSEFNDEFRQIMVNGGFVDEQPTDWETANRIAMGELPPDFLAEKPSQPNTRPIPKRLGSLVAKFTGWGERHKGHSEESLSSSGN